MQYEIGQSSASSAATSDSHEQWKVPGLPERASRYQSAGHLRGDERRIAAGLVSELRARPDAAAWPDYNRREISAHRTGRGQLPLPVRRHPHQTTADHQGGSRCNLFVANNNFFFFCFLN